MFLSLESALFEFFSSTSLHAHRLFPPSLPHYQSDANYKIHPDLFHLYHYNSNTTFHCLSHEFDAKMIPMSLPSVKLLFNSIYYYRILIKKLLETLLSTFLINTHQRFQPHFIIYMQPTEIRGLPVSTPLL